MSARRARLKATPFWMSPTAARLTASWVQKYASLWNCPDQRMTGPGSPAEVIVLVPFCFSIASMRFCNASTVGVAGFALGASVAAAGSTPSSAGSAAAQARSRPNVRSVRVMRRR